MNRASLLAALPIDQNIATTQLPGIKVDIASEQFAIEHIFAVRAASKVSLWDYLWEENIRGKRFAALPLAYKSAIWYLLIQEFNADDEDSLEDEGRKDPKNWQLDAAEVDTVFKFIVKQAWIGYFDLFCNNGRLLRWCELLGYEKCVQELKAIKDEEEKAPPFIF